MATEIKDYKLSILKELNKGIIDFAKIRTLLSQYEFIYSENYYYQNIINVIYSCSLEELKSKSRKSNIVRARYSCYNYLKFEKKLTLGTISFLFSKDHSSVIYGIREHNKLYSGGKGISDKDYINKYDEFIQKTKEGDNELKSILPITEKKEIELVMINKGEMKRKFDAFLETIKEFTDV